MKRSMTTNCLKLLWAAFATTALISRASAQGTFQNLDFEDATITPVLGNPDFPYAVYASNAIPAWTAYIGNSPQDIIHYNFLSLGAANVSIMDNAGPRAPLEGLYTI